MKPQTQVLMIALAVVFAIGLALTVALISLSIMQKEEPDAKEPLTEPSTPDLYIPTAEQPSHPQPTEPPKTEAPTPTKPVMNGVGLVFEGLGGGTCRVSGIGTCRDAFVVIPERSPNGDTVIEIGDRALMGCETVTAIQIPSTVNRIGELALAACPNLIYVSVNEGNTAFRDSEGVLYTADGTTLLLYPPMRAGSTVYLSRSVTDIADMAFYQCAYLSSVRYAGTPEDWDRICIGAKNYSLTAASKTFSAAAGK